jgi:hypothetical protein
LFLTEALIANLDPQDIKKHHRIDRVERSVLPLPHLAENGVRNAADELARDIGRVE